MLRHVCGVPLDLVCLWIHASLSFTLEFLLSLSSFFSRWMAERKRGGALGVRGGVYTAEEVALLVFVGRALVEKIKKTNGTAATTTAIVTTSVSFVVLSCTFFFLQRFP
ncbi:hypothetical protein CSUI_001406 [Cystoisospora suis]|uniref:Transmembrane protein n=1 Tax=Cystoisospora suis TaxID=483139 RepID=A0A2C6L8R1_9APIC|nr:hypothetical protein CSUI_001406 [Cystoisospora suis]